MRASLVVIPLVTLIAGAVFGGALGYALGARTAMERERAAIQAVVEKERAAFKDRAAAAAPNVRSLIEQKREQADPGAQPPAAGAALEAIAASRPQRAGNHQRLDPKRQTCVGGFVREFGEGANEQGRRGGERDLLENGRRVECSGLLRQ